ncbi:hypothetical protein OAG62_01375 [bacterium]|nr:hypothetical protein [bacterium]
MIREVIQSIMIFPLLIDRVMQSFWLPIGDHPLKGDAADHDAQRLMERQVPGLVSDQAMKTLFIFAIPRKLIVAANDW